MKFKKKTAIQKDSIRHEHAKVFDISNDALHAYPTKSADFNDQSLVMAFADGSMLVCDMLKNRDETAVALKMEDYKKAKQLIDANILLYLDGSIDQLHKSGEKVLQKIITLIELGKIEEAVGEAKPFMDSEAFSEQFTAYMSQRSEMTQFVEMDEYMSIDYLKDHIAFTIKLAYLNSIPSVSQEASINWKKYRVIWQRSRVEKHCY
ncbi:MAG TPA: hypothetical protein EYG75_07525 [Campylobacterales bacterium]|nr:hypothetical protein [Campylobacterales bacterium]